MARHRDYPPRGSPSHAPPPRGHAHLAQPRAAARGRRDRAGWGRVLEGLDARPVGRPLIGELFEVELKSAGPAPISGSAARLGRETPCQA